MSLTDIKCKSLQPKEKTYKVFNEKSLYLEISTAGKENRLSFGAYPEVTLKEDREKRGKARKQITDGINPSQAKKLEKLQTHINHQNNFENIARQWHEKQAQRWTERHSHYVLKRLEADVFKEIGNQSLKSPHPNY